MVSKKVGFCSVAMRLSILLLFIHDRPIRKRLKLSAVKLPCQLDWFRRSVRLHTYYVLYSGTLLCNCILVLLELFSSSNDYLL